MATQLLLTLIAGPHFGIVGNNAIVCATPVHGRGSTSHWYLQRQNTCSIIIMQSTRLFMRRLRNTSDRNIMLYYIILYYMVFVNHVILHYVVLYSVIKTVYYIIPYYTTSCLIKLYCYITAPHKQHKSQARRRRRDK